MVFNSKSFKIFASASKSFNTKNRTRTEEDDKFHSIIVGLGLSIVAIVLCALIKVSLDQGHYISTAFMVIIITILICFVLFTEKILLMFSSD